ncbi:MAG TPA: ABC transporter permease [Egibacteraceae bacterium]|nr:ABC transporter permease [Egibacteraceae bacterium]
MSRITEAAGAPAGQYRPDRPAGAGPDPSPDGAEAGKAELLPEAPSEVRRSRWIPVLSYAATVFVLVSLNFAVPRLMPGDPIAALMAQGSPNFVADDETRANLARYYKLDEPLPTQYVHYLSGLVRGDLGYSIYSNRPVSQDLRERLPWTLLLIAASMLLSFAIGLPLGVHSAWKRGQRVDRGLLGFFLSVQNLPVYFVASVALLIFSVKLGLFPLSGASTPFAEYGLLRKTLDVAHHLALPALLLALGFAAYQYLVMRSAMVSELGADYLLGGRAKGLRERRLKYGYAGRNALLPVVTVVGMQFSLAVTSAIFVEQVFAYPGAGLYMFNSVFVRDYPAIQGSFLVLTIAVVTVNLLVDLLYRRLDPRTAA